MRAIDECWPFWLCYRVLVVLIVVAMAQILPKMKSYRRKRPERVETMQHIAVKLTADDDLDKRWSTAYHLTPSPWMRSVKDAVDYCGSVVFKSKPKNGKMHGLIQ
jgi:hypothetical protein